MTAEWAAVIVPAVLVVAGSVLAAVRLAYARGAGIGRREGKIDDAIEMLTKIAGDHEARLRAGRL